MGSADTGKPTSRDTRRTDTHEHVERGFAHRVRRDGEERVRRLREARDAPARARDVHDLLRVAFFEQGQAHLREDRGPDRVCPEAGEELLRVEREYGVKHRLRCRGRFSQYD